MNKVFNINLGGYPFTIDEDAYNHLKNYLKTIHNHFEVSDGYEEITSDIEARLAELFQENLSGRPIVTIATVKDAIAVMGTPEDFGATPIEEEEEFYESASEQRRSNNRKGNNYRTGKRLFRNPEEEVVGGVCSGIAAYFGIEDPIWVRLGFVVLFFAGGFAIPAYLILWAVVPAAKTAADRLAMKGVPITTSNIGKIIEEEMGKFGEQMTDLSDDISEKFGSGRNNKKKNSEGSSEIPFRATLTNVLAALGALLKFWVNLVLKIIKPLLFIIGIVLIIVLSCIWLAGIISLVGGQPYIQHLFPDNIVIANFALSGLFILLGMVFVGVLFSFAPILFGRSVSRFWKRGAIATTIVASIAFFSGSSFLAGDFKAHNTAEINHFSINNTDNLNISYDKNIAKSGEVVISGDRFSATRDEDNLQIKNVELFFKKSKSENIEVSCEIWSRGKNRKEAEQLAKVTSYDIRQNDNELILPSTYTLQKGTKFRGQKVNVHISIPEGKTFVINETIKKNFNYRINGNEYFHCDKFLMQGDKFTCFKNENKMNDEDTTEIL